jgi:hypothetical protein
VLTHLTLDGVDIIVLYVSAGQSFETVVHGPTMATPQLTSAGSDITATPKDSSVTISGSPPKTGAAALVSWGKTRVIIVDKATAKTYWQPRLSGKGQYATSPDVPSVLVGGPYLVRSAKVSGSTLELVGDTDGTSSLTVIAPKAVNTIKWNGASVTTKPSTLGIGLTANVGKGKAALNIPALKDLVWKSADSLPEIDPVFDDSKWTIANKTTTARPAKPFTGKYMLYADEYGAFLKTFTCVDV